MNFVEIDEILNNEKELIIKMTNRIYGLLKAIEETDEEPLP
jgi:hypothetical protein